MGVGKLQAGRISLSCWNGWLGPPRDIGSPLSMEIELGVVLSAFAIFLVLRDKLKIVAERRRQIRWLSHLLCDWLIDMTKDFAKPLHMDTISDTLDRFLQFNSTRCLSPDESYSLSLGASYLRNMSRTFYDTEKFGGDRDSKLKFCTDVAIQFMKIVEFMKLQECVGLTK